jgi:hypothetical protein
MTMTEKAMGQDHLSDFDSACEPFNYRTSTSRPVADRVTWNVAEDLFQRR